MNKATSVFLDLVRILAALGVVVVHAGTTGLSSTVRLPVDWGHRCVVIFFVLSGFVIAYAVESRRNSLRDYAVARLSRLYSVLLPALAITAILLVAGKWLNASYYEAFTRSREPLRFVLSLLFLQENWSLSAAPYSNSPLWSLAYEFWYYALFGLFVFVRPRRYAVLLILALAAFIGHKILLLMPVWLLGVGAFHLSRRRAPSAGIALAGGVASAVLTGWLCFSHLELPYGVGRPPFYFSNAFLSDFATGIGVAGFIVCFSWLLRHVAVPSALETAVRAPANLTFSLYLLHHPLAVFVAAVVPYDRAAVMPSVLALTGVIGTAVLIGSLFEPRRKDLARYLDGLLGRLGLPATSPAPDTRAPQPAGRPS